QLFHARLLDGGSARRRAASARGRGSIRRACWAVWLALGRAQVLQALRRLLERRIKAADAEPCQGRLDAVDDRGVLANEGLALAGGDAWHPPLQRSGSRPSCSGSARRAASRGRSA